MKSVILFLTMVWSTSILCADSLIMVETIKPAKKQILENYQVLDSNRLQHLYVFYPQLRNHSIDIANPIWETGEAKKNTSHYNYYYILFLAFVLISIGFARFFPYPFKLQYSAFFIRSSYIELLSIENDWLEAEKIFPFILSILFFSTFGITPILSHFSFQSYSIAVVAISAIAFTLVFLVLRIIQLALSHTLEFEETMRIFSKSAFNTNFNISLIGFPFFVLLLSIYEFSIFTKASFAVNTLFVIYAIRTLKSILNILRCETRQIIYLIIYLCTLEIPLLLIGVKWISDNTPI